MVNKLRLFMFLAISVWAANCNAGGTCPDVPFGQSQNYRAWFTDEVTGEEIADGAIVPTGTNVLWHGLAEAQGYCEIYAGIPCVYAGRQEHDVIKIGRSFYTPTGLFQPFHDTYGVDPETGKTAFYHILDTEDSARSTGPRQEYIYYEGPYTFISANFMSPTACDMQPDRVYAPIFTIIGRKPKKRRCDIGSEQAVFGNPCDAMNGIKQQVETDFAGGAFDTRRIYSSDTSSMTVGLGYGWGSSLTRRLERGGAKIMIVDPNGGSESFNLADGVWTGSPDSKYASVVSEGANYVVTSKLGKTERFSKNGKLQLSTDAIGRTTTYVYDAYGQLSSVVDAFGRSLLVSQTNGRIDSLGYVAVDEVRYSYTNGQLTSVTYADDSHKRYSYDSRFVDQYLKSSLLTSIIDEDEVTFAAWTYDDTEKVQTSEHAPGSPISPVDNYSFTYSGSDYSGSNTVIDPRGVSWNITYSNALGSKILKSKSNDFDGSILSQGFDYNGNRTEQKNRLGVRTCSYFDGRHLETYRVEGVPADVVTSCSYLSRYTNPLPEGSRRIVTDWHPDWDVKTKIAEPSKFTTYVYNGQPDPFNGDALLFCAPAEAVLPNGKPIIALCKTVEQATTDDSGASGFGASLKADVNPRVASIVYNLFGQILTETDPRGKQTTYEYWSGTSFAGEGNAARGHWQGDLKKVTNALGHKTEYLEYNKRGQPTKILQPNGSLELREYHVRGWPTKVTLRPAGTTDALKDQVTQYDYYATGLLKQATQPDGSWATYTYDAAHRLTDVADSAGNSVHYVLDNTGSRTAEQYKDPNGALAKTLSRTFDALGRLSSATGAP